MLREFLFLQHFMGRAIMLLVALALFCTPLGFALESRFDGVLWWYLPATPLGLLALLFLWVLCSLIGLMPSALAPWAMSTTSARAIPHARYPQPL